MSVKFNTSNLKDTDYATYNLEKFNGVDYTDTPTNVDDSRAIDISNYLPEGNSLRKRKGWTTLESEFYEDYELINVFRLKNKYVFFGKSKTTLNIGSLFIADDINFTNGYRLGSNTVPVQYATFSIIDDYRGWAVEKDNRLFVFTGNRYLMVYSVTANNITTYYVQNVINFSYIPTIAIGVQDNNSYSQSASSYEELNLLSNKANIEFWFDFSDGTYTSTEGGYYWSKKGYFDLSNYFVDLNTLGINEINDVSASTAQIMNTGYYGFGVLTENGEHSDKMIIMKLENKILSYEAFGITSGSFSYPIREEPITDINEITFNKKVYSESEKNSTYHGYKKLKIQFTFSWPNGYDLVEKMQFGFLYGANNYRDTLFVSGNPDYPNLDIHTCTPKNMGIEDWVSYTYFGDMSYHKIGSSSSAIIGYGINSDSSLLIFKQSISNEPNVYVRTANYKTETKKIELSNRVASISYDTAYVLYQVYPSAINIKCDKQNQIIQFDNKVFINGKFGIYYVNVNTSTAESSYDGVEASYLIREDLSDNILNSSMAECDGKLYVSRISKDGKKRIYVCDKNRYSYHNSKQIYEWWVLDNIPVDNFYVFDEQLYFSKAGALYGFIDSHYDFDKRYFSNLSVGDNSENIVTELFFDYQNNEMIIAPTNEYIQDCKTSNTPKEDYQEFESKTKVLIGDSIYWNLDNLVNYYDEDSSFIVTSDDNKAEIINTLLSIMEANEYKFCIADEEYQGSDNWEYVFEDGDLIGFKFNSEVSETQNTISLEARETPNLMVEIKPDTPFDLVNLNDGTHNIKDCVYINGAWIYIADGEYDELGSNVVFNHFNLACNGIIIDFELVSDVISNASLESRKPVKSYWISGYSALGKLDFLKTATNIYFVPDARKGGYTHIGYRTYKKEVGFYSNSKTNTLSFDDINFDDFSFGQEEFGRTYSAKKKIKNFSFIQIKFYSNDESESTLVSCAFRYKYSKNNKGVK